MSLLDTIEIQGIRSIGVGPQNAIVIEFLSPLTIICGPNGSGKTTIIEALKYATTNELPPGKMPTFIHDYRIANKTRIDASVKLKFKDIRNRSCVVTRRMTARAEGTKSKLTTRSEESTIAIEVEADDWKSLSSKVVDCKKEVLNLLGVPAAILEYVVFCHQEESTWPLEEPKKLKERFDEIFQVSGYVKAIELLKKEMKENKGHLQISQARLPFLIEQQSRKLEVYDLTSYKKLHNEYIELKRRYEMADREMKANEEILAQLKGKWEEAKTKLQNASETEREFERVRTEHRIVKQQYNDCAMVPDFRGTVAQLKQEIEKVSNSAEFLSVEKERFRIEDQMKQLKTRLNELQSEKSNVEDAISQLKAVNMLREKLHEEKREAIASACKMFNLTGRLFFGFQKDHSERLAACQKAIDACSIEFGQIKSRIGMTDCECAKLNETIQTINSQLNDQTNSQKELKGVEFRIDKVELEIGELERQLNEMNQATKSDEGSSKNAFDIDNLMQRRDLIAAEMNKLQSEYKERQNEEGIENELKRVLEEKNRLEGELKELTERHQSSIKEIFNGDEIQYPIGLVFMFIKLIDRLATFLRKLDRTNGIVEEEYQDREKKYSVAKNRYEQIQRDLDQIQQQIDNHQRNISKVLSPGEDIEAKLSEMNQLITKTRNELGVLDGCRYLYDKWDNELREKTCCPLCERKYKDAQEANKISSKMNMKRAELPDEIERLQRRVREYEEQQSDLMEVQPYVNIVKRLLNDRSELESDLKMAENKRRSIEEEVVTSRNDLEKTQKRRETFRSIQADASLIDKTWTCLNEKCREIKRLEAELNIDDDFEDKSRVRQHSVAELRNEIERCENEFRSLISAIDQVQSSVAERSKVVEKLNAIRENRLTVMENARQQYRLIEALKNKQSELDQKRTELLALNMKLPTIEAQLQAKIAERSEIQTEGKNEENELSDMRRAIEAMRAQINVSKLLVIDYQLKWISRRPNELVVCVVEVIEKRIEISKDGVVELEMKEDQLKQLKSEAISVDESMRTLQAQFDNVNTKQERKRRLDEQLKKMELAERIVELEKTQERLSAEVKTFEGVRREESLIQKTYSETSLDLERTRGLVQVEGEISGEMGLQKKRISEMKEKLCSREFLKCEEDFKKEVITKCVTAKVIEVRIRFSHDLSTYIRAVDESIVEFHAKKMEEINEILASLWERVYRGSDVEKIQIKSESVDESEKRKSYNYRVVMHMDGKEIDMPGRCSAGQKMLASILIRIALSDVFCDKCSIIALDEPTTNLDVLKVENLGDILSEIIEERNSSTQKAFQLIVITHDYRFVEHLRQLCRPEWLYSLTKDTDGLSRIKRHRNITETVTRED
ncbi:unnamed protein product [Anisakis simplex]|uniref:DNA repair protein rad-50 (inferred by orthology to a C. elegans protein) n=1 Tax=Anisakis simplex TaxID=6269 RepID=A0A158PP05_ANISI|nr:unnamed protein product [Anisakis simplex]